MFGSLEGTKLGVSDGKMVGTVLWDVDVITLEVNIETYLVFLDRSCDCCKYEKLECLLLGNSLKSIDVKVLGSDERIILGLFDSKVLGTVPWNVYGIKLWLDVGT